MVLFAWANGVIFLPVLLSVIGPDSMPLLGERAEDKTTAVGTGESELVPRNASLQAPNPALNTDTGASADRTKADSTASNSHVAALV